MHFFQKIKGDSGKVAAEVSAISRLVVNVRICQQLYADMGSPLRTIMWERFWGALTDVWVILFAKEIPRAKRMQEALWTNQFRQRNSLPWSSKSERVSPKYVLNDSRLVFWWRDGVQLTVVGVKQAVYRRNHWSYPKKWKLNTWWSSFFVVFYSVVPRIILYWLGVAVYRKLRLFQWNFYSGSLRNLQVLAECLFRLSHHAWLIHILLNINKRFHVNNLYFLGRTYSNSL